jgi:hypothetical protein
VIASDSQISNGESVADSRTSNGEFVASFATDNPLLIVSNGLSVAAKSATDKSVAKKSATTNLHPICAVADSVAKLF